MGGGAYILIIQTKIDKETILESIRPIFPCQTLGEDLGEGGFLLFLDFVHVPRQVLTYVETLARTLAREVSFCAWTFHMYLAKVLTYVETLARTLKREVSFCSGTFYMCLAKILTYVETLAREVSFSSWTFYMYLAKVLTYVETLARTLAREVSLCS